jgi:phosphatidate cytidylyltransferase
MKLNNFTQRIITGLFFVLGIVGLTLYSPMTFKLLLIFISVVGQMEYYKIVFGKRFDWYQWLLVVMGAAMIFYVELASTVLMFLPMLMFLSMIKVLFSKERKWQNIGHYVVSMVYIPLPLFMFYHSIFVHNNVGFQSEWDIQHNAFLALNLFILIWSSDTFAYVCGRLMGKTPLFPSVSPKKTWEGFVGGAVLTLVFSYFLAIWFDIPLITNLTIAFLTVVFGSIGDLVESMLKREHNIKDSGNVLPGHGGVLDRFDALLVSLPFTTLCYYVQ